MPQAEPRSPKTDCLLFFVATTATEYSSVEWLLLTGKNCQYRDNEGDLGKPLDQSDKLTGANINLQYQLSFMLEITNFDYHTDF